MTRLRGLYAITDPLLLPGERLYTGVAAALRGGARCIQYRDKTATPTQKHERAQQLLTLCRRFDALFFINDDLTLAEQIGADGVHRGQSDEAKRTPTRALLIGTTCHGDLALADAAVAHGAHYLAFGRFFASPTKPNAPPCSLATLQAARQRFERPLLAIGGVTPDNGAPLIAAGADMIAAISGVFGADDIEAAARRYTQLFHAE